MNEINNKGLINFDTINKNKIINSPKNYGYSTQRGLQFIS